MEVNKKILVTGGTGFLGSYLLRYLVQKGYNNIFSIRRVTSNMDLVKSIEDKIQWVECDILDVKGLEKVMEGVKQVYHSAAMVSFETKHQKKMHLVNIQGTANVVNLALENNIEKLVHVSSIAALGRLRFPRYCDQRAVATAPHPAVRRGWIQRSPLAHSQGR